jgi:zinc transport system substrate-binding protein
MNVLNIKTIYYQELIDPKTARVIAEQTGAKMVLLHGAHNVTTEELQAGATYVSIMRENAQKLMEGFKNE